MHIDLIELATFPIFIRVEWLYESMTLRMYINTKAHLLEIIVINWVKVLQEYVPN